MQTGQGLRPQVPLMPSLSITMQISGAHQACPPLFFLLSKDSEPYPAPLICQDRARVLPGHTRPPTIGQAIPPSSPPGFTPCDQPLGTSYSVIASPLSPLPWMHSLPSLLPCFAHRLLSFGTLLFQASLPPGWCVQSMPCAHLSDVTDPTWFIHECLPSPVAQSLAQGLAIV